MADDSRYLGVRHRHLLADQKDRVSILHVLPATERAYIVVAAGNKTVPASAPKLHNEREDDDGKVRPTMAPPVNPTPSAVTRAQRVFSWLAILAPRRVWSEEVGDALETIARMEEHGRPQWQIWLKVASTIFWVLLNGIRELAAGLTGRKSPHK